MHANVRTFCQIRVLGNLSPYHLRLFKTLLQTKPTSMIMKKHFFGYNLFLYELNVNIQIVLQNSSTYFRKDFNNSSGIRKTEGLKLSS